jgi:hypothetical protein
VRERATRVPNNPFPFCNSWYSFPGAKRGPFLLTLSVTAGYTDR